MKDTKDFQERYNRWKNGERYWDIRCVELPKYDTGKYVTVEKDDGSIYNVNPNVVDSKEITVTTPEVEIVGKKPNFYGGSAFKPNEAIHLFDKLMGNTVGRVMQPITKIPGAMPVLRTLTPSNWVGTIRTGVAPWSENNPGFGTSENDQALNSLFNYGMSTAPLKVNALPFLQKLKYSKIGEKIRGIKVTDEVYHGSRNPFDISKARTSNIYNNDSGFHVGSSNEPTLFKANKDFGGITYKGKLQLKEPAFEVPDFERWNPYQFWYHAKQNKTFAEYLKRHGLNYEDFYKISDDMNAGVQQLADKIKNSGIALKYKNKYETLTGDGYSYYLSNPKQAHFTEVMDFGTNNKRKLIISPYEYVMESTIADLVGNNQWKPLISDKNKPIYITPNFYKIQDNEKNRNEDHPVKINLPKYGGGKIGGFVHRMGPLIYQGLVSRGVKNINAAYANLMRQISHESGYGTSSISRQHNYGGIKIPGSNSYRKFKSDRDFADYYLNLMTSKYRNAIDAKDLNGFVNELGSKGYFRGQTASQYLGKLNTLKSLDRAVAQDLENRRDFYNQTTGIQQNPETNEPEFVQPIPKEQQSIEVPYLDPQKLRTITFPVNQPIIDIRTILPKLKPIVYQYWKSDESFDHGKSGIHINPANRGKFNATKKRTGKTTKELTHSKNPLTRKRAIFALNASKWNKK